MVDFHFDFPLPTYFFSFALSFLSNPPRALVTRTIQYNSYNSYILTIHSISIHQLHFYAPSPLRERQRERERETKRFESEGQHLYPFFFPSSLHIATRVVGEEEAFATGISTRAVDKHGILRQRLFSQVQFNTQRKKERKKERKREQRIHYYPIRKAQLSLSRSKSYLSISHFKQTNLTGTAGEIRVVDWFPTTTTTTTH